LAAAKEEERLLHTITISKEKGGQGAAALLGPPPSLVAAGAVLLMPPPLHHHLHPWGCTSSSTIFTNVSSLLSTMRGSTSSPGLWVCGGTFIQSLNVLSLLKSIYMMCLA
jgi:hypothetical protein